MTEQKDMGRPRKDPSERKFYDGLLHALLVQRMPELVRGGRVDTHALSRTTGNARYTCYRWMQEDRLSPGSARRLLEVAAGRIKPEELTPFVLAA